MNNQRELNKLDNEKKVEETRIERLKGEEESSSC